MIEGMDNNESPGDPKPPTDLDADLSLVPQRVRASLRSFVDEHGRPLNEVTPVELAEKFKANAGAMVEAMRQFEIGTVHDGSRWVAGWNPPKTPVSWVENESPLFEGATIEEAVAKAVVGKLGGEGG